MSASFISFGCSVCFGDPASLASKSLQAGVLLLVGVVGVVLGAIAITGFIWARRAKRLEGRASS